MKIAVILTCFNRSEKTRKCLLSLINGNPSVDFTFYVVNDGSTDSTEHELKRINAEYQNVVIINTTGGLFYSKGMRKGMEHLNRSGQTTDYVLLVNDDVEFKPNAIEKLVKESTNKNNAVIVGATCDDTGIFTYGGVKKKAHSVDVEYISNEHSEIQCDSFNANCVLIPWNYYINCPPMDGYYAHAAGDFDYGFDLYRHGAPIFTSSFFVGTCNRNKPDGTWHDRSLSRITRIKKKETAKGLPFKSYFHYLNKNYGLGQAIIFSLTPYIKILLGK